MGIKHELYIANEREREREGKESEVFLVFIFKMANRQPKRLVEKLLMVLVVKRKLRCNNAGRPFCYTRTKWTTFPGKAFINNTLERSFNIAFAVFEKLTKEGTKECNKKKANTPINK